jgi:hypothetical protein
MKKKLLVVGGAIQIIFGVFHILLAGVINEMSISPFMRALLHTFNIAVIIAIAFFAVVSLFYKDELLFTRLGRFTILLIAVFYLVRAADEIFLFDFNPVFFVSCSIVGALYLWIWFLQPIQAKTVDQTGRIE